MPALSLLVACVHAQIPAFPGAQGYGGYAAGGRGGDVYTVTNLNSSGAGSFNEAVTTLPASGRTIVFAVSGYIPLSSTLRLAGSKVTIAGQTAPGDGVGLRNSNFRISGDDVIVRHLRFRHGKNGNGGDCVNLDSGSIRCVLDHIGMQFSTDENMSSFGSPPENLTLQWSLNAWGLLSHSAGGLWDQNHATCHHSLWAHNHTRDPKARPSGVLDWVNNVTFDYGIGFIMGDSTTPADWKANVRNSYFICPPGNIRGYALSRASLDRYGNPNFSLHLDNCRWDRDGDTVLDGTNAGYGMVSATYTQLAAPVATTGAAPLTMDDPTVAWKKIVSAAGPLRLDVNYAGPLRDEVDTLLMQNLVTQTGSRITRESDLPVSGSGFGTLYAASAPPDTDRDGMPDYYETALGWNPAVQDHNTALASSGGVLTGTTFMPSGTVAGYTRLEEYLHYKAIPHGTVARNISGAPTSLTVNLAKFTSGFSASPVFTTSNATGGTVSVAGSIATFTPTVNFSGRARFDFTVTDAQGHSWTQTVGIVVTTNALPRELVWRGSGAVWDTTSANWRREDNGATTAFATGDRVSFTGAGSAQPSVSVPASLLTGGVEVDAAANFTFSGAGGISATGDLTKRGSGTLTVSNTGGNSFSRIAQTEGTLAVTAGGLLGTAPLRLEGGTFNIGGYPTANPITVVGPATITGGNGGGTADVVAISGSAPLTIAQTSTFDLAGDISGYTGTMTFTGTGQIRLNENNSGSTAATFNLASAGTNIGKRTNIASVSLGALRGVANSTLQGATGTGNTSSTTYVIGENNADTTFDGRIINGGGTTAVTKSGNGNLILTGASTYTGATLISDGDLTVNGSLGATAVTIASGAKLRGQGSIGGAITMQSGSQISPGAATLLPGTLAIGAGLSMDSGTLSLQLSGSPTGANDKIVMTGGTLALAGTNTLTVNLTDTALGEGGYEIVTGGAATTGSASNLTWTPPASGRQTFALTTPPGKIVLTVTGAPATLRWLGTGSTWDSTAALWANTVSGVNPDTFLAGDAVLFDDTAASGTVTAAAVSPRNVTVTNTTRSYAISGGPITCAGRLEKNGTGTLTLNGANTWAMGTVLNAGTIALGNATANADALDGGTVTLNGGTLRMFDAGAGTHAGTLAANLAIAGPATLQVAPRCGFSGNVSGSGALTYYTPYVRADITGNWSAFTGSVNVTTDGDGGDFRIASSYAWAGLPHATIHLNPQTYFYFSGISSEGEGTTIEIGELTGAPGSVLQGGVTGGRALTYRIGGRTAAGGAALFSGTISEQNTSTLTNYVKTGAGKWTITGGSWSGGTTVEQGILEITGSAASAAATTVEPGASLILTNGTLDTESLAIASGAALLTTGTSRIDGELNNAGTITVQSGSLRVESAIENNGTVVLNTARRILTAARTGTTFTCTVHGYTGHTFQLQRADSPAGPWTNAGSSQPGAGAVLTFTHTASAARGFYRVAESP